MPIFNWNKGISNVPDNWRTTNGKAVKIAILDSGIDLSHPALQHLDIIGRKFNAAKPNFDLNTSLVSGIDDVTDAVPMRRAHGTYCSSVLAAQPEDSDGVEGMVSQAELNLIKITDANKASFLDYFINGMRLAIALDVDVINVSYFPIFRDPVDEPAIKEIFQQIVAKRILVIGTFKNTSRWDRLNNLDFPSNRPECLVTGTLKKRLLQKMNGTESFDPNIHFVFPPVKVEYCTLKSSNKYLKGKMTSSFATTALTGVSSLLIAHWKQTEGTDYKRRTKTEIVQALNAAATPFSASAVLAAQDLTFFKR